MSGRRLKGIVVLGLVAAVAGCGDGGGDGGPDPSAGSSVRAAPAGPAASAEARELLLPFDTYKISKADDYLIAAAEDVLMRDCMKDAGVGWTPREPVPAAGTDPPNRRRYGVIEAAVARRYGFHAPPDPAAEVRFTTERDRRANSLDEEGQFAAYGADGTGGCWKRAHERLLDGVPESDYGILNRYAKQAFEDGRRDGAVREVFRAWSACVKKDGFRYPDPLTAANDPAWGGSTTPSARELRAAESDVRCKEKTGLVTVWSAAETRIQRNLTEEHTAAFRALRATREGYVAAARRVLGDADGR
ncbi:hypothetical protein ACFYXF_48945 [Streptomyces sp. NPDC002680]|uniref:hypothetical protein n=1 Tax=Streptomyces sp. NPDC002680 TaxID=3364659 RepID=UPI0036921A85